MNRVLERALRIEQKVRHVRTPEGSDKYGQPIGSVITTDLPSVSDPTISAVRTPSGRSAARTASTGTRAGSTARTGVRTARRVKTSDDLVSEMRAESKVGKLVRATSDYEGRNWIKWRFGKKAFHIGKYERGDKSYVVIDENEKELHEAATPGEAKLWLEAHLGITKKLTQSTKTAHLKPATEADKIKFKEKYGKPIPPGWHDVRITTDDTHHMIASGVNSTGGTTYLYARWYEEQQAAAKWKRVREFEKVAGKLDAALKKDALKDDTAAVVLLMRRTGIRVGGSSEQQRGDVPAFGASTLQNQHVTFNKDSVTLQFVGKEGVAQKYLIRDPEVVAMFRARQARIEQRAGGRQTNAEKFAPVFDTDDKKTIAYLREKTGGAFKNHDLRTYLANVMANELIQKWKRRPPKTKTEFNRMRRELATVVSDQLGNKPAQALASYINPAVFTPFMEEDWA